MLCEVHRGTIHEHEGGSTGAWEAGEFNRRTEFQKFSVEQKLLIVKTKKLRI